MEQKKAKLFHVLKIAYYCLGFPVFFLAVLSLVMQNYGHVPFMGPASGQFIALKSLFSSPAMYAIWIALGLWVATVIVQVICNYFVKNRNSRVIIVMAAMLVILLLPIFIIDGVYTAKLENIAETAPEGVVVKDYKTHLSYYRTQTSGTNPNGSTMKVSYTDDIKKQMLQFCTAYNVPYHGVMFQSSAGSFENEGLCYDDFGYDYNADGVIDRLDHILIKNPIGNKSYGRFEADSLTLTNYKGENPVEVKGDFYCMKYVQQVSPDSKENVECYVWYLTDKATLEESDGYYGRAYYNKNGMLADGYIFSVEVALNILEEYYQAQEDMKALFKATGYDNETELRVAIEKAAMERLEERYTGANATDAEKILWEREKSYAATHSLTIAELNNVLAELGGVVGEAKLITGLLPTVELLLGGNLSMPLGSLLDLVLGSTLPETLKFFKANLSDVADIVVTIKAEGNLQLIVSNLPDGRADITITVDENLSTETVKSLLDDLGISNGMLAEVLTLVGFTAKADDNSLEGLENMLAKVLETLYWYRSPVIEPEYNFYVDETLNPEVPEEKALMDYQAAYAKFKRAEYEGSFHGSLAGSKLIGSSIGDGTHSSSEGLANLQAVQQMKTDLSFIPEMYSVLIVRDMLMTFAGLIIFFTIMSYIAAEREMLWATGQIQPKKSKKDEDNDAVIEDDNNLVEGADESPVQDEENNGEVA